MDLHEKQSSLQSCLNEIKNSLSELQKAEIDLENAEAVKIHNEAVEAKLGEAKEKQAELEKVENQIAFDDQQAKIKALLEVNNVTKFEKTESFKVPARARVSRPLRSFDSNEEAYLASRKFCASILNHQASKDWLNNHGIYNVERLQESDDDKGGIYVPSEVELAIIRLVEQFGVARQYCERSQMNSDHKIVPVRTSGMTAYAVGEATDGSANGTSSIPVWKSVELVARKWKAWCKISEDLSEDSLVELIDKLVEESAQAFAEAEDDALFNGDGSSTYHGITGLKNKLAAGSVYDAATGELAFADLDLGDFEDTAGLLPHYPGHNPAWFISKVGYWASMARLMNAAGGQAGNDIANGPMPMFLGYPVVFSQKMYADTADSASNIACYLGDMSKSVLFGDRRGIQFKVDGSRYFDEDNLAFKATCRMDIAVHSPGDASTAGPIVALKFAAS